MFFVGKQWCYLLFPVSSFMIDSHPDGVVLSVRVSPGAKKNEVRGEQAGALKVCITTAPEKGKANKTLLEFLSKYIGIKKSQIELLSGETSTQKKLLLRGLSVEEAQTLIGK